jgi:hypothetical protein
MAENVTCHASHTIISSVRLIAAYVVSPDSHCSSSITAGINWVQSSSCSIFDIRSLKYVHDDVIFRFIADSTFLGSGGILVYVLLSVSSLDRIPT